jgi:putative transposase
VIVRNERDWDNRDQLAAAIFEWIEAWYNPTRRHSSIRMCSPAHFEAQHANDTEIAA